MWHIIHINRFAKVYDLNILFPLFDFKFANNINF